MRGRLKVSLSRGASHQQFLSITRHDFEFFRFRLRMMLSLKDKSNITRGRFLFARSSHGAARKQPSQSTAGVHRSPAFSTAAMRYALLLSSAT
jgi:hypothetical protein